MLDLDLKINRRVGGPIASGPEAVVWVITGGANGLTASGSTLIGTNGLAWNCVGAPSKQLQSADGYIEATLPAAEPTRGPTMLGFHTADPATMIVGAYYQIKFQMQVQPGGTIDINNSGSVVATPTTWSVGDVVRVSVVGTQVKYYKNGSVIYTDAQSVSFPLWGAGGFYNGGSGTGGQTRLTNALLLGAWT